MDSYIIELFGGTTIEITREDYQNLLGKTGLVFLKSSGRTINTAGIKQIVDAKTYRIDKLTERQQTQKEGILHDGTPVIKHFGSWYLLNGDYDERGAPHDSLAPFPRAVERAGQGLDRLVQRRRATPAA
jgi:hypothetical protein